MSSIKITRSGIEMIEALSGSGLTGSYDITVNIQTKIFTAVPTIA